MKLMPILISSTVLLGITVFGQQDTGQKPEKIRVSWNAMKGNLEREVEPELPKDPNGNAMRGHVVLRINIDVRGDVVSAVRMNGKPELADAAIVAVKQWKFKPFLLNGQPLQTETEVKLALKPDHAVKTSSPF